MGHFSAEDKTFKELLSQYLACLEHKWVPVNMEHPLWGKGGYQYCLLHNAAEGGKKKMPLSLAQQ